MQVEPDRVRSRARKARPRTPTYKVTVGYHDGYIGEGQISLRRHQRRGARRSSAARDRAAAAEGSRLQLFGSARRSTSACRACTAWARGGRSRTKCACGSPTRTTDRKAAEAVGFEVRTLHVNGPGGGGGGSDPVVREVLARAIGAAAARVGRPQVEVEVTLMTVASTISPTPRRRQGQHVQHLGDRLRRSGLEDPARAAHRRARHGRRSRTSPRDR